MNLSEALAALGGAGASLEITPGGIVVGDGSAIPPGALATIEAHTRQLQDWWSWSPAKLLECERCGQVAVNTSASGCPLCSIEVGPNRGRAKRRTLDPSPLTGRRPSRVTVCTTCGRKVKKDARHCDPD